MSLELSSAPVSEAPAVREALGPATVAVVPPKKGRWRAGRGLVLALLVLGGAAGTAGLVAWHPWRKAPATVAVERRTLQEAVDASGTVTAIDGIVLRSEATGRVKARLVEEDQAVTANKVLLRIDDGLARLQLAQARTAARMSVAQADAGLNSAIASLVEAREQQRVSLVVLADQAHKAEEAAAQATRELTRNGDLVAEGAVTTQLMDSLRQQRSQAVLDTRIARGNLAKVQAGAEVLAARNQLAQAQTAKIAAQQQGERSVALAAEALAKTTVRAPVAGRVSLWLVAPGDWLTVGTPIANLLDPNALRLKLRVDELDVPKLGVGQAVKIAFDAFLEEPFTGRISRIGRASETGDAGVQAFPVDVSFTDTKRRVRPGMNAEAHILVREVRDAIAVPLGAVRREGQQLVVTRAKPKGGTETVEITPGISTLTYLQVRRGLAVGDRLVVAGATTP